MTVNNLNPTADADSATVDAGASVVIDVLDGEIDGREAPKPWEVKADDAEKHQDTFAKTYHSDQ